MTLYMMHVTVEHVLKPFPLWYSVIYAGGAQHTFTQRADTSHCLLFRHISLFLCISVKYVPQFCYKHWRKTLSVTAYNIVFILYHILVLQVIHINCWFSVQIQYCAKSEGLHTSHTGQHSSIVFIVLSTDTCQG